MDVFFSLNHKQSNSDKKSSKGPKSEVSGTKDLYASAFEQKMKEMHQRRMEMLFLKRLENDGAQIMMSKADRELFRLISSKEDDEAE